MILSVENDRSGALIAAVEVEFFFLFFCGRRPPNWYFYCGAEDTRDNDIRVEPLCCFPTLLITTL